MTVEELKKIANEMGYNIIKKQEYIKLLPCKCGCNQREHWYSTEGYYLVCKKCRTSVFGRTERDVRLNWNRMVSEDE